MQSVQPGDIVFSFKKAQIVAVSTAISSCYDAQKPEEFGASGENWDSNGWKVDLKYTLINHPISPTDHEELIAPLFPANLSYGGSHEHGSGATGIAPKCRQRH